MPANWMACTKNSLSQLVRKTAQKNIITKRSVFRYSMYRVLFTWESMSKEISFYFTIIIGNDRGNEGKHDQLNWRSETPASWLARVVKFYRWSRDTIRLERLRFFEWDHEWECMTRLSWFAIYLSHHYWVRNARNSCRKWTKFSSLLSCISCLNWFCLR